jgi:hypothetical protein
MEDAITDTGTTSTLAKLAIVEKQNEELQQLLTEERKKNALWQGIYSSAISVLAIAQHPELNLLESPSPLAAEISAAVISSWKKQNGS